MEISSLEKLISLVLGGGGIIALYREIRTTGGGFRLRRVFSILARRRWVIFAIGALVPVGWVLYVSESARMFEAEAYINLRASSLRSKQFTAPNEAMELIRSPYLARLVESQLVTAAKKHPEWRAMSATDLDDIGQSVSVRPVSHDLLQISAAAKDPSTAIFAANAFATTYLSLTGQVVARGGTEVASLPPERLVEVGFLPAVSAIRGRTVDPLFLLGLSVSGILIGCAAVLLRNASRKHFENVEELREAGYPVIGYIPRYKSASASPFSIDSGTREAFRLSAALLLRECDLQGHSKLLITSSSPGDGKTTYAANIAAALAAFGKRTLLIDADLRMGRLVDDDAPVLSECLSSGNIPEICQLGTSDKNLFILSRGRPLPHGRPPANPSELIRLGFDSILGELSEQVDMVIVDSPPATLFVDAMLIEALCDASILIVRSGFTQRAWVEHVKELLSKAPSYAVLNDLDLAGIGYGYGFGTGYHAYEDDGAGFFNRLWLKLRGQSKSASPQSTRTN